jgi:hypothetical protein
MARRSGALKTILWAVVGYELAAYVYNGIRANQVLSGGNALPGPLPLDGIGAVIGYGPFVSALTVSGLRALR